jgi:hypothetical protein
LIIVAADSSAAILNEKFEPLSIVAAAAVLVESPFKQPNTYLAEPIFVDARNGHDVIIHEAELCEKLLSTARADAVHLDMSLGALSLEELSPVQLSNMRISARAKRHLIRILPKLRKIAGEITRKYGIDVLAIGKESVPVRIAELTSGAHAILYAGEKVMRENQALVLGLPSRCQPRIRRGEVYLYSLMAAEHDLRGYARDTNEMLERVNITEMLNPIARGFRALKMTPKR